jgi:benzylsuccinate CoA-transferase BbsF subunit
MVKKYMEATSESPEKPKIFEGMRVICFAWIGVAAQTVEYLSEYGAELIKIESYLRPDPLRMMAPFKDDIPGPERSFLHSRIIDTAYSMTLNLKHPKGVEIAKRLVAKSDVVIDGWTPGTLSKLGLDYENLRKVKDDIIMLSTCMQGQTGPAAAHLGYGTTLTSLAGFNYIHGWPDRAPSGINGPYTDNIAPTYNALSLIAAIDYRRRTGKGQYLDLSQYECGVQFLTPVLLDYLVNGRELNRKGNSCSYAAPYGVYRCRGEDRWCAITVFTDEEWKSFCKVLNNPKWTKKAKFATLLGRLKNASELDKLVEEWTINHSAEEVMLLMQNAGVAAGVLENGEDLWNDSQLKYRNSISELEHPETGTCVCQRVAVTLPEVQYELSRPPLLGEHTYNICKQVLNMPDDEFVELLNDGIFQ